uniref:NHERF family PDZ scaffold protein 2 n=1 Tax=Hippocampus comes TaxID=109280 RepID=A0A3Q2XVK5_HIPCM
MASERKPRLCVMTKGEQGYGFHLHGEKGKTGQFIRKVEPGSSAEAAGLRAGDRLVAVNGVNVERETHHQVVQRIKAVENETRLLVVDQETHERLRNLRLTATEEMAIPGEEPPPPFLPPDPPNGGDLGMGGASSHEGQTEVTLALTPLRPPHQPTHIITRSCAVFIQERFHWNWKRCRIAQFISHFCVPSSIVNGVNIEGMRHSEVVAFIKKGGNETWLLVVDPDTDEYFKMKGVIPTVSHVKGKMSPLGSKIFAQSAKLATNERSRFSDPFAEIGLSATAAEEKRKLHAKEKRRAPQMDWMKKYELFSNF